MKIERKNITIRTLTKGFADNAEQGVVAYGGKLDIRPPYQREFIYKDEQRNAVIDSVRQGFPLNTMYWAVRGDGSFEVMDGQQRTLSICQYVNGDFTIDALGFNNLQDDQQKQILDYELMIYRCSGTDSEKLKWFETINIAGVEHTKQEIRNAVYVGPWTASAKRYFSKTGCPAFVLGGDYVDVYVNRQELLELAIKWRSEGKIQEYMAEHQHDKNADPLWNYFQKVIRWVKATFPKVHREMKWVDWGGLYNQFKDRELDAAKLAEQVAKLMRDDEVQKKSGIYPYLLDGDERHLNLRTFSDAMKREAYEKQNGICPKCKKPFEFDQMEGDHVDPWHLGGKTIAANCQMLCKQDNRRKSGK